MRPSETRAPCVLPNVVDGRSRLHICDSVSGASVASGPAASKEIEMPSIATVSALQSKKENLLIGCAVSGLAKRRGRKKKKKLTTDFGIQMYLEALHHPADDGTSEWTLAVGSLCDLKTGGKWASERVGAGERPSAVILEFHAAKPGVKCRGAWCIVFESEGNKMHARVPVSRIRVPRR